MQKMTGNIPTMTPRIICVLFFMAMAVMQASGQLREVPPSRHGQPEQRFMEEWKRNPPRPLQTADTAVLVFIGDVMLHTRQMENSHERYLRKGGSAPASDHEAYDFSPYLEDIRDSIMAADVTVANMEFTLGGPPFTGYPSFSAPDSYARYMAECGVDVFLTANNHICDKGQKGFGRTLRKYREMEKSHGIKTAGSHDTECPGSTGILYVRAKGIKIAILNFTYGTNVPAGKRYKAYMTSISDMEHAMGQAKAGKADLIIALPHWGNEYTLRHSKSQEETAEWLAENGADIIIGSHPHVVQDCDTIVTAGGRKVPVIYSLGNIISNMSAPDTQLGLMLTVRVAIHPDGATEILRPEYRFTWCSLPGRLTDSHKTVFVRDYIGRQDAWQSSYEWLKMKRTYFRVRRETGIEDME